MTEAVITDSLEVAKTTLGLTLVRVESAGSSSNAPNARAGQWQQLTNLQLRAGPDLEAMALNSDAGIIAVYPSLLFKAWRGGAFWRSTESEWPGGSIMSLTREHGRIVLITTSGKLLTEDGDDAQWLEVELLAGKAGSDAGMESEHIVVALFRNNELPVLVGSRGTVVKKIDGEWTPLKLGRSLPMDVRIVGAAFGENEEVVLVGSDGTYFRSQNGNDESPPTVLRQDTQLVDVALEQNWELRVLVDSNGTFHTWTGSEWNASSKPLALDGERFIKARLGTNGDDGLVVGSFGSVFTTADGGANWQKSYQLPLNGDVIEGGAFCDDDQGVFVTLAGSVWTLGTGRRPWSKAELPFEPRERVDMGHAPAFSVDGQYGLVVGEDGSSVTITRDCGRTWTKPPRVAVSSGAWVVPNEASTTKVLIRNGRARTTYWHDRDARFVTASASPYEPIFAGVTDDGDVYLLRRRSDLNNWEERAVDDILTNVGGIDVERDMQAFIGGARDSADGLADSFDRLMLARGTTLVFLLFLLHLLARVYQYTQRLSAFWNSRADAIALRLILGVAPSADFDALVKSLAPDAYDFGPAPGSLVSRMLRGRL